MVWCLSSDENRERSSSAPFVGKTGRRSFPTEDLKLCSNKLGLKVRSVLKIQEFHFSIKTI